MLQLDLQTFCMFLGVNLPRAFAGLLDEVSLVHSGDAESALLLYLKRKTPLRKFIVSMSSIS